MPLRRLIFALLLAPRVQAAQWVDTVSAHFIIKRQTAFAVGASTIDLERLHNRLRLDLAAFSPWMAKERVTVFVYPNQASYSGGEFHPPAWSNGIAFYDRRIIAVYAHNNPEALDKIIAHEMTHLLFESYWAEENKMPPSWLNEGLAMLEETQGSDEETKSEWYQGMTAYGPKRMVSFSVLTKIDPNAQLQSKEAASYWYVTAYSVVHFLLRQHSKLQFVNFCKDLREGRPLDAALWSNYRYANAVKFEAAWKTWLADVSARGVGRRTHIHSRQAVEDWQKEKALEESAQPQDPDGKQKLKPIDFRGASFHNFRGDR